MIQLQKTSVFKMFSVCIFCVNQVDTALLQWVFVVANTFIVSLNYRITIHLMIIFYLLQIFGAEGNPIYSLSDNDILTTRLPCTSIQFIPIKLSENDDKRHVLLATCKQYYTCRLSSSRMRGLTLFASAIQSLSQESLTLTLIKSELHAVKVARFSSF